MVEGKKTADPFKTYIHLQKKHLVPLQVDQTAARSTWDQCQGHVRLPQPLLRETRGNQVYILLLLMLVNNCPNEHFRHVFLRDAVLQISAAISEFKGKAELGEF